MSRKLTRTGTTATASAPGREAQIAIDLVLGAAGVATGVMLATARAVYRTTSPITHLLWRPPLVPTMYQPAHIVAGLVRAGGAEREVLTRASLALLDEWVPIVVAAIIDRLDLTRLVAEHVDLDALVARVDLDAAVARVDVDAVVARADVDAVVARADLDAVVARVDIDAIIARIDLDAVAATLDVDAVIARADLDEIIDRIDIVGIVEDVLEVIDLPGIIRDSTGSMASETVRGVRMAGVTADDAVGNIIDRALFRRRDERRRPEVTS